MILQRLWLLHDEKELRKEERKTIKKQKQNTWKIVRLHAAIKRNSMNVFEMNLADFFGEKQNYKKNYLMMDLSSSTLLFFIAFAAQVIKNYNLRLFYFTFVDFVLLVSRCKLKLKVFSEWINYHGFWYLVLCYPLPDYPLCVWMSDCAKNKANLEQKRFTKPNQQKQQKFNQNKNK